MGRHPVRDLVLANGGAFLGGLLVLTVRCVIPSQSGAESLLLLADHFAWIGAAKTLEFEVLADGVIEQSHAPQTIPLRSAAFFGDCDQGPKCSTSLPGSWFGSGATQDPRRSDRSPGSGGISL